MIRTTYSPQSNRILLDGREVINMAANNYLGLANHPALVEAAKQAIDIYGVGPGAGRTIVGNYPVHNELEAKLAAFKQVEAALVFNSGLTANLGTIPSLVGKGDMIFSDELNHASIIDGCRLSRADIKPYKHLDMTSLQQLLEESAAPKKLIVTDGVFSMDGDLAPLPTLVQLAKQYNAILMVDDAHGDGVMGKTGRGTVEHFGLHGQVDVETGSLSKAFGAAGGFVAGKQELIDYMRKNARSFIFTSSPLPQPYAAAAITALDLIKESDERIRKLWDNREYFASQIIKAGFSIGNTQSPIIPVYIGDESLSTQMSERMYGEGIFAQSIQYPFVAKNQARIRIILSALHSKDDLDMAVDVMVKMGKELKLL